MIPRYDSVSKVLEGIMSIREKENFTEEYIKSLVSDAKSYEVGDTKIRNFFCRISPKGVKTYLVIKNVKQKPVYITIGKVEEVNLKDARIKAVEIIDELNKDKNRNKEKKQEMILPTLTEFFETKYIPQYAEKYTKPKTLAENISIFRRRMKKKWGQKHLKDITRDDIEAMHSQIKAKDGIFAANKALTLIKHLLNKAVEWRCLDFSTATGIKPYKWKSRERFINPEEMARFFAALETEPDLLVKGYIYISLYTGQRCSNVLSMRWRDIDLTNKVWHIPDTKNGSSLNVPLIPEALALLTEMKSKSSSDWVFPSEHSGTGHWFYPQKMWKNFLKKAEIQDLRLHDIRRTLGSYEAMAGVSLPLISKTLGHKSFQATEVYARMNVDSIREAISSAVSLMRERATESKQEESFLNAKV